MKTNPQNVIRNYLMTHRRATAQELIRLGVSWDVRKIISRLRKQGDPIETKFRPGVDPWATYLWTERQDKLF